MPTPNTGILDLSALLKLRTVTVQEYGYDAVVEAIQRELAIHNELMMDMVQSVCFITTERSVTFGGTASGSLIEADEFARVPTQETGGYDAHDLPLRSFQYATGWTAEYFRRKTPYDVAQATINAEVAHRRGVSREIKRALFPSTNYSFTEYTTDDRRNLSIKRLLNADGARIPMGPYGETFDGSTHTHYVAIDFNAATGTQKGTALKSLVNTVVEHGHKNHPVLIIHRSDEERVMTAEGFVAYSDPRRTEVPGQAEEDARIYDLDNKPIGYIGMAEVWVKPWAQPNYVFAYDDAETGENMPAGFRQEASTTLQGLRPLAKIDAFPLHAEYLGVDFGVGVKSRSNGAVLYLNGGTYVSPSDTVIL